MTGPLADLGATGWDGEQGELWAEDWEQYDRALQVHHRRLVAAASVAASDQVLDIGCGNGQTTRDAARLATAGAALGLDLSPAMVARARQLSVEEGVANVSFEVADAQTATVAPGGYDVALSRFGVMYFDDPVVAFVNIGRSLRPGGRLVFVAWRGLEDNEWLQTICRALDPEEHPPHPSIRCPGSQSFAHADEVRQVLGDAGFGSVELERVDAPVTLGDTADDALHFALRTPAARAVMAAQDHATRKWAISDLRAALVGHEAPGGVLFGSSSWLVTATRP
jgi:SAM-dependent methyltransferase